MSAVAGQPNLKITLVMCFQPFIAIEAQYQVYRAGGRSREGSCQERKGCCQAPANEESSDEDSDEESEEEVKVYVLVVKLSLGSVQKFVDSLLSF